jgi:hypothetical protein
MIILLGFIKTGSSSFQHLFNKLGLNTIQWYIPPYNNKNIKTTNTFIGHIIKQNKANDLPLLTGLTNYGGITQIDVCLSEELNYWPQVKDYEQLYNENKDAIFILNYRQPEKILNSILKWGSLYNRIIKYNKEILDTYEGNTYKKKLLTHIKQHYKNILEFFNKNPESKFIFYDIEKDNITKLNKYIDTKGLQFPHKNINASK